MNIKLTLQIGIDIFSIIDKAKELSAKNNGQVVETEFNGVNLLITETTDNALLWRDIQTARLLKWDSVGPNPAPTYSGLLQTRIDAAEKERDAKQAAEDAEYKRKSDEQRLAVERKIANVPFSITNSEGWEKGLSNNSDGYGRAIYDYSEAWAKLMQVEIESGARLEDIADKTSHELSYMGITGFMYGAAVSILSQCWVHGDALKRWHNKDYGQPDAEGVVNPAILSII